MKFTVKSAIRSRKGRFPDGTAAPDARARRGALPRADRLSKAEGPARHDFENSRLYEQEQGAGLRPGGDASAEHGQQPCVGLFSQAADQPVYHPRRLPRPGLRPCGARRCLSGRRPFRLRPDAAERAAFPADRQHHAPGPVRQDAGPGAEVLRHPHPRRADEPLHQRLRQRADDAGTEPRAVPFQRADPGRLHRDDAAAQPAAVRDDCPRDGADGLRQHKNHRQKQVLL